MPRARVRGMRAPAQLRARSARPARSLRSLATTPARLRSQALPATSAVRKSVVARGHTPALLLPPRSRQAPPLLLRGRAHAPTSLDRATPTAPLLRPPSALIGCRPPIGRLHIVYRLARCVARSLRSLAIARSSRSSQTPQGLRVVPSLPLLDHRHYGGGLLRAAAWLITDAGLPAACVCRGFAVGSPPPAGCGLSVRRRLPPNVGMPPLLRPDGRCPRSARAISGLPPRALRSAPGER